MHSLPRTPSVTWTSARCYTARQTGGGSCPVTWHWLEQEAAWLPAHLCLEPGTHVLCCCCVRLPSLSVLHEVDAKEESPATHISNYLRINWCESQQSTVDKYLHLIFQCQLPGSLHQQLADVLRVLDQSLLLDDVQHGGGDGTAHRVTFKSSWTIILIVSLQLHLRKCWNTPPQWPQSWQRSPA